MRRSEREARACQLMCGRERAPGNKYRLCQVCMDRVREIEQAAKQRRTSLFRAPWDMRPGYCGHTGCELPNAAQCETAPCETYCVAHCVTHKHTHKCRRTDLRKARARYRERQRVA